MVTQMSTNDNSSEIIVKGSILQEIREEDNYPDPSTLPLPNHEPRISDVTLSESIQLRLNIVKRETLSINWI